MTASKIAATLFVLASLTGTAQAETISATCSTSTVVQGDKTTCDGMASFSFDSEGPGANYGVRLKAPSSHCSDIRYIVLSGDATLELGRTGWLKPGNRGQVEIGDDLARGLQVVQIKALGRIGGCNTGALQSWSADARMVILP